MSKPDRESVLPPAVVEAVTREVQRRAEVMDSPFWGPLIRQSDNPDRLRAGADYLDRWRSRS